MDGAATVTRLVENINNAFSARNVANSASRVQHLSRADFLTISRELGILGEMSAQTFRRYRRNMTIPPAIQRILTSVHRSALFRDPPIPMRIEINDATPPSIEITATDQLISIRLNRPHPHTAQPPRRAS
jgi:hypothetical protein